MAKKVLTWNDVNAESLPKPLAKLLADYKAKQAVASAAAETFKEGLSKALHAAHKVPTGMEPIISMRFGKIAVAFDTAGSGKSSGGTIDL